MIAINEFLPEFPQKMPETYRLLKTARLKVHPRVRKITLHGSRGPAGGFKEKSDIDLTLVTDIDISVMDVEEAGTLLRHILEVTLHGSKSPVELDLAAAFDNAACGLRCLSVDNHENLKCPKERDGCLGLYKIQKGFNGFVPPITQVKKMYPYLAIWQR